MLCLSFIAPIIYGTRLQVKMLVCGQVNPPALSSDYNGVYFGEKDNMEEKAKSLRGLPLQVEHDSGVKVGQVISGWVDKSSGAMWALAEINTERMTGAFTAAAVEKGAFRDFSLGYKAVMNRDPKTGRLNVGSKNIHEVSIVKKGARDGCHIAHRERPNKIYKKDVNS